MPPSKKAPRKAPRAQVVIEEDEEEDGSVLLRLRSDWIVTRAGHNQVCLARTVNQQFRNRMYFSSLETALAVYAQIRLNDHLEADTRQSLEAVRDAVAAARNELAEAMRLQVK